MPKPRPFSPKSQAVRLVKTWLPATLVRQMDDTILSSSGAYNGRDDFIREAIADRIAEERARPGGGPAPLVLLRPSAMRAERGKARAAANEPRAPLVACEWSAERLPLLPPHSVGGLLYGLHNRDYPTLWVTNSLLAMTSKRGEPIAWSEFLAAVLQAAWDVGAHLAKLDAERGFEELKASVGFPTNAEKRQSSESRFLEHMLGVPDRATGPTGPVFALKLAGTKRVAGGLVVAPTPEAVALWQQLASAGYAACEHPPYGEAAWHAFRSHLRDALPGDYEAWLRVLRAIAPVVTRENLVRVFESEWSGAAAATNVAGYVSRAREWGLVEPKLRDGRYALTALGMREIEETAG